MKKIEAIIKPFKLDEVKEELQEVGVQGRQDLHQPGGRGDPHPHRRIRRRGALDDAPQPARAGHGPTGTSGRHAARRTCSTEGIMVT
jgi:hypothetical protein